MVRQKIPIVVPVGGGLDLANSPAALQVGRLVRALNKAPGVWGPRHGTTFIDRASRGRGNPTLNGSTAYLTGYYNTVQMDLGRKFSIDVLFKIGTLSGTQQVACHGDASFGAWDISIDSSGTVDWWMHDDDDNGVYLNGSSTHSNGTVVHSRITRSDGTLSMYVDGTLEDADTATITSDSAMKVRAQNVLIGKPPGYSSGFSYFSGTFGGLCIRNFVDTDFTYAYSELPNPRGNDVLVAWTGELIESDAYVRDASRYCNPLVCSNVSSGSRVPELFEPIQSVKAATVMDGRLRNMVLVGGNLYSEVV